MAHIKRRRRKRKFAKWFRKRQHDDYEPPEFKWRLQIGVDHPQAAEIAARFKMVRDRERYFRWFYDSFSLDRCIEVCKALGVKGSQRRYVIQPERASIPVDPPSPVPGPQCTVIAPPEPKNPPPPRNWKNPVEARAQRALALALRGHV